MVAPAHKETALRLLCKTVSWRIVATLATALLVWLFTGELAIAMAVGGLEVVLKMVLYYGHERVWERLNVGRREKGPMVFWLTGLSGSGKSTLAEALVHQLELRGRRVEHLDGDTLREVFPSTGFGAEERDAHIRRVGYLASRLEENGVTVVASFISPQRGAREFVRGLCENFVEVHVATPLEECERRDVKGLYARARRGDLTDFTGISAPYEAPPKPELRIDTKHVSVAAATEIILSHGERGSGGQDGSPRPAGEQERAPAARGLRKLQRSLHALVHR
ncbi:MAG: adenylyl-sulfate kinase [Deltaproteobacteria bacterium]|nr:adenylyl-sulfate kinase [Deltaproteobacteria bacterium]